MFFSRQQIDGVDEKSEFCLQHFSCVNSVGEEISLIIVMNKDNIPADGEQVDFTKYDKNILVRKKGALTQADIDSAVSLFRKRYLAGA